MRLIKIALVVVVVLLVALVAKEKAKEDTSKSVSAETQQTVCPVMGGKIDSTVSTVHEGDTIYFCCPGCIGVFEKDPTQYLEKMKTEATSQKSTDSKEGHTGHSGQ